MACKGAGGCGGVGRGWTAVGSEEAGRRVGARPQGVVQRVSCSGSSYGLEFGQESPVDFSVMVAREIQDETFCSPSCIFNCARDVVT